MNMILYSNYRISLELFFFLFVIVIISRKSLTLYYSTHNPFGGNKASILHNSLLTIDKSK